MEKPSGLRPGRRWELTPWDEARLTVFSRELGIRPILAQLMLNRGIDTLDTAHTFLYSSLADLPSPFLLEDMQPAVNRLVRAITQHESIVIYGDYDLDGVSGTAVLASFLEHYGAKVTLFIPVRDRDGYGLQKAVLERLIDEGAQLVVTCDNGTSAFEEIAYAASRGVDVIVTDHHTLPEVMPAAVAVLNPMRKSTPDPFRVLSGAGVAFMLVLALRKTLRDMAGVREQPNLKRFLDLVALGTIADVVPLTGINRVLVKHGLDQLAQRNRAGLKALLHTAGVQPDEALTVATVGYRLAPRLNAAGRLEDALRAVRLLMTEDPQEATRLADNLEKLNRRRQELEEGILKEIKLELSQLPEEADRLAYVFGSPIWHSGVIGIVAARLVELTQRPSVVVSLTGRELRGSGRSIPGFDLVEALKHCEDLLVRYGGHKMAAGLSLKPGQLETFRQRFEQAAALQRDTMHLAPSLTIDARLPLVGVDEALVADLDRLKPCGVGNPEPVFASTNLQVLERRTVGRGHLRLVLSQQGKVLPGIGFGLGNMSTQIPLQGRVSLAYCPQINVWKGSRTLQLRLWDLRPHQSSPTQQG